MAKTTLKYKKKHTGEYIGDEKITIRSHPPRNQNNGRFDWIRINYGNDGDGIGKVYLFLSVHYDSSKEVEMKNSYVLTRSLKQYVDDMKQYPHLPYWKSDSLKNDKSYILPLSSFQDVVVVLDFVTMDNR